jgi:hypothetical protein
MGAGSTVFAKNVLGDSMLTPSLEESTIALYDIDAFLSGYSPSYFRNVPIFDTVTSLQTVELIPIPEGARPELSQDPPSFLFGSSENETL